MTFRNHSRRKSCNATLTRLNGVDVAMHSVKMGNVPQTLKERSQDKEMQIIRADRNICV